LAASSRELDGRRFDERGASSADLHVGVSDQLISDLAKAWSTRPRASSSRCLTLSSRVRGPARGTEEPRIRSPVSGAPLTTTPWDDYRRATVYGFFGWLCNLDVWQPADVNTATYARFGTAMLDHDTYAALRG
jgi:hypothetical protein